MTTDLANAPTTPATPAPAPVKDKGPEALLKKGQRVVIQQEYSNDSDLNGRHGTIERVETVTFRTIMLGIGGSSGVDDRSHYYYVRTDGGYLTSCMSYDDLVLETEPAPEVIPDPTDEEGKAITIGQLCRSIKTDHDFARTYKARAARARVAKSINSHNASAGRYTDSKNNGLACLDAWCVKYPEGRALHAKTIEDTLRAIGMLTTPKAQTTTTTTPEGGVGVRMTENEERDGVELRFDSKPDANTLATLKANGWRWAMRSRCWYARRNEETLAFARSLAGEMAAA